jgi:hypothetical protein
MGAIIKYSKRDWFLGTSKSFLGVKEKVLIGLILQNCGKVWTGASGSG